MNNLLPTLKNFFTPPVFEGDEEKSRTAVLLTTILYSLILLLVAVNVIMVTVSLINHEPLPDFSVSVVAILIFLGMVALMRMGFVKPVSLVLSFVVSGIITYSLMTSGVFASVTVMGYVIAIIVAGLLAGGWSALMIATVNFVSFAGLNYLASNGVIQGQVTTVTDLITTGSLFALSALFLGLSFRNTREALDRAQRNEEAQIKANQELRELQLSLEQRIVQRTQALTSVAEISTAASTILETEKLLQQVVDLAKERFGFYHAHIYLVDETTEMLVLSSGAGDIGRQMVKKGHSIPMDREQSLVARAAREKQGVTVNDVTQAPDFLPNPLLPETRSELAVPMMVGEKVIGVFDVQSEAAGRFTEADIAVQTTLASQVASAVQNARSYTEIQRSQELLSEALSISGLANWEYDVAKDLFTFNDQFYSIFRTSAEKVGGYKLSSADYARLFVHPDDAALVGLEIQKTMANRDRRFSASLEHRIIFPDGEIGYITVNINVERDENGNILRWYGANQNVTERRKLEELNRKHALQQEAINRITQKIQSAPSIEEAMQVAARELGHALGRRQTLVTLEPAAQASTGTEAVNKYG